MSINWLIAVIQLVTFGLQLWWTRRAARASRRAMGAAYRAEAAEAALAQQLAAIPPLRGTELGRCGYPMAVGGLATIHCCLAPRHHGDHAYSQTDLRAYCYVAPF